MTQSPEPPFTRRALLQLIGTTAGTAMMYETMVAMGYAGTSDFTGPIKLSGDVKGASVLILGSGLAGMTAAYELRKAGYKVSVLEYNDRPGGRNWSLYGGDTYTELGGATQHVQFDKGLYFNPGPWRLPYHHQGILHYCKLFNVPLELFSQINFNAYIHSTKAFGGSPKRYREIVADFDGYVAELMAKATSQNRLDGIISPDEKDGMLQLLRDWGALDKNYEYKKSDGDPSTKREIRRLSWWRVECKIGQLRSSSYAGALQFWHVALDIGRSKRRSSADFPAGRGYGNDRKGVCKSATGFDQIQLQSQTAIRQDEKGGHRCLRRHEEGWDSANCARGLVHLCAIPDDNPQSDTDDGAVHRSKTPSIPWSYAAAFKVGLHFKRRFWEEDDQIYGGISYTDQLHIDDRISRDWLFQRSRRCAAGGLYRR